MSNNLKAVLFAVAVSIVCGSLLTLASTGLKDYQLRNIAIDKQKNVLMSVGLFSEKNPLAPEAIVREYVENIKPVWIDSRGGFVGARERREGDLPVYLYLKKGRIRSYVIPFDSRGLWGNIQGYLAMDKDGATVSGFTVFTHKETPGLGGEIEKEWFRKNFEGKKIIDGKGDFVSVGIVKGKVEDKIPAARRVNYVDGISGASMTGKFLSAGLKDTLGRYETVSKKFRSNEIGKYPPAGPTGGMDRETKSGRAK
jgi:Na+-transporting NADH:ubiquinone oxidoreductase subunit C